MIHVPGYWKNETSGVLRPAVEAYLHHRPMTGAHIAAMRAYCRQWIAADGFVGPDVEALRRGVDGIQDRASLRQWLDYAEAAGCDPL